jgi:XRE family transcriptional regulator, fatty acid utilization regulator
MQKTFIGPHLRRLRLERGETQGSMAQGAGHQRILCQLIWKTTKDRFPSRSCCGLFEVYGVDWREIADEDGTSQLADLRAVMQDPLFHRDAPGS